MANHKSQKFWAKLRCSPSKNPFECDSTNSTPSLLRMSDLDSNRFNLKMMEILTAYGIPNQIVKAINALYKNTTAQMLSPEWDTDSFEILAGVLQGDTLVPYLFIPNNHWLPLKVAPFSVLLLPREIWDLCWLTPPKKTKSILPPKELTLRDLTIWPFDSSFRRNFVTGAPSEVELIFIALLGHFFQKIAKIF